MTNKNNIPAIRFKGFNDTWEQRKLGDEAIEILAGGDIDKSKTVENGKYPIYANALTNDGVVGYYDDYYRVKAPAVTVTGRGEVGFAQARMVDFTPVVRLLAIRSNHDCYFLENAINNHKVVVESTGVPQLTVPQLSSYNIFFPKNVEEETRIGEFLHNLDSLITLHQRKLDKLNKVKISMLGKMFPKNGADVPEVRFKGFTDSWEQRKVKDIADNTYGGGTPQTSIDSYWNGEIPWIQSQDIIENQLFNVEPRKHISEEAISKSATKLVPKNSIAIVTRVGVGKLAFMPFSYCTSQDFLSLSGIQIDEKYATYSIYQMLQKEKQNVQGTSIKGITIEEMLSKKIPVPCNSDEQGAIGAFFHNLDTLITLHQRKLEKLRNIKKSMLEKMFV